jgi:predicted RNase H-like HicB family nuclease
VSEDVETLLQQATVHAMAGGVYFAEVPGLIGVWGHGATEDECLAELKTALETMLESGDGEA